MNKTNDDNTGKTPFYKKWWFWLIVVVVIIGVAGAGASQETEEAAESEKEISAQELSEDVIENECTDAKYGINKDYDPIDVTNYGFSMSEYGNDRSGNMIYIAQWNGKRKSDGSKVVFQCYASGEDSEHITVHYIGASGEDVWKTMADVEAAASTVDVQNTEKANDETIEISTEQRNALKKAKSYAKNMHMSKQGVYDQLVSEYGEGFSATDAQWAIDNLEGVDWKANALAKAKSYYENMSMAKAKVYDQLVSEYGEKFTPEEAQYAIDNL